MSKTAGGETSAQAPGIRWLETFKTEDGLFAVDARQRIIHWGPTAQALLGYEPQEVLGRPCHEVIGGVDGGSFRFCRRGCPIMVNALRGRTTPNYDVRSLTREGKPVWLNVSVLIPERQAPRGAFVVHLFRDVTERRKLEQAAQRAVAELRELITDVQPEQEAGVPATPVPTLTPREIEVLKLLAVGVGTKRIASTLGVSPITARNHITNLVTKLGVENRLQAVVYASQNRLI